MQIPLTSECLTQSIDCGVVDCFKACDPSDKEHAICDAMSLWELIKDFFNEGQHYKALSCLFDLARLENINRLNNLSVAERNRIVGDITRCLKVINQLIDVDYQVAAKIVEDQIRIGAVYSQRQSACFDDSDLLARLFEFSLIDATATRDAWRLVYKRIDTDSTSYDQYLQLMGDFVDYFGTEQHAEKLRHLETLCARSPHLQKMAAFVALRDMENTLYHQSKFSADAELMTSIAGDREVTWKFYFKSILLGVEVSVLPPASDVEQGRGMRGEHNPGGDGLVGVIRQDMGMTYEF